MLILDVNLFYFVRCSENLTKGGRMKVEDLFFTKDGQGWVGSKNSLKDHPKFKNWISEPTNEI